jgi:hypothetical protein
MSPEGWDQALQRWTVAGLVGGDQAAAIRAFEAGRAPAAGDGRREAEGDDRFTATEALVYAGAAAILGGLVYLVASSTSRGAQAGISLAGGLAGLAAARALAAGQARTGLLGSGRRAAAVCAAASIALVGAGVSLLAIANGWLVISQTYCYSTGPCLPGCIQSTDYCYTSYDHGADAILGAAVALTLALAALELLRSHILAVLVVATAYITALVSVSRLDSPGPTMYAIAATITGAFLALVGLRAVEVREPLLFAALIVPVTALFLTDSFDQVGAGGVLAGLAAACALALAVRADSNGLAVAGGLGVFGFCVDLTARSLGSTSPALVLIVSGLALVVSALLVQRAVRRNRVGAAT